MFCGHRGLRGISDMLLGLPRHGLHHMASSDRFETPRLQRWSGRHAAARQASILLSWLLIWPVVAKLLEIHTSSVAIRSQLSCSAIRHQQMDTDTLENVEGRDAPNRSCTARPSPANLGTRSRYTGSTAPGPHCLDRREPPDRQGIACEACLFEHKPYKSC